MNIKEFLKKINHKILFDFILRIAILYLSLLLSILSIRIYEYYSLSKVYNSSFLFFTTGLINDIFSVSKYFLFIILINLILIRYNRLSSLISHFFNTIYLLIYCISVIFFINAITPLDHSVYTYKFKEIIETIKSTNVNYFSTLIGIISLLIYFLCVEFLIKIKYTKILIGFAFILILVIPVRSQLVKSYTLTIEKYLTLSKTDYFIYKSYVYFKTYKKYKVDNIDIEIKKYIDYRKEDGFFFTNDKIRIDSFELSQYPLLHIEKESILNKYIDRSNSKPNIVIIIVESLGFRFFNNQVEKVCYFGFLDSLAKQSLFWTNCFSTSERTYGAIPSITGSLPYGETGFSNLQNIPEHLSINSILKQNGYYTYFFYGGWTSFQGMHQLLTKQRIDYISDYFPSYYKKMLPDKDGFAWGYPDGEVYKRSLEVLDSINKKPFSALYLTLSTHSPFSIPERNIYENKVIKLLNKTNDNNYINRVKSNIEPYIAAVYSDNCLRKLFAEFKKRKLYNNTIFIITGDHHMHELGRRNELEVYNVPLIIHSPLISKPKVFTATVSHQDIAPSLLNYMKTMGYINYSDISHWLGSGLDTVNTTNKFIPFMRNSKDVNQCVYMNYFLNENELYQFSNGQEIIQLTNAEFTEKIKNKLMNFDKINKYTSLNHAIIPLKYIYNNNKIIYKTIIREMKLNPNKRNNICVIFLDKNYDEITFDVKFQISYEDTLDNPILKFEIFDKSNKYIDYYHLVNSSFEKIKNSPNKIHNVYINRRITDSNSFHRKNKLEFFWYNVTKKVDIRNFELNIIEVNDAKY